MLGKMQSSGLLVKRAAALEKLDQVTHVVFDKTGTLTLGRPVLKQVMSVASHDSAESLAIAAAIEQHSAHPLARALVQAAGDFAGRELSEVRSVAGGGLQALPGDRFVLHNDSGKKLYFTDSTGRHLGLVKLADAKNQ